MVDRWLVDGLIGAKELAVKCSEAGAFFTFNESDEQTIWLGAGGLWHTGFLARGPSFSKRESELTGVFWGGTPTWDTGLNSGE